jgi:hypothetical protein
MYISLWECNWKGWSLKLVYIKLPMYMALDFVILMGAKSITWRLARVGPIGTRCAHCHFRALKSLNFSAHPFQWPSQDIVRIKIITTQAIKTKGT